MWSRGDQYCVLQMREMLDGDVKVRELKRQGLGRFIVFFGLGVGGKGRDGGPPTRHVRGGTN